jgi:hypothetical protein
VALAATSVFRGSQSAHPPVRLLPKTNAKTDGWKKQKRQMAETKPLESFNKTNGIVEQNQWNRSAKSMESFRKTNALVSPICQFTSFYLPIFFTFPATFFHFIRQSFSGNPPEGLPPIARRLSLTPQTCTAGNQNDSSPIHGYPRPLHIASPANNEVSQWQQPPPQRQEKNKASFSVPIVCPHLRAAPPLPSQGRGAGVG